MLTKRVIPCLDVKDGRVVKGVNFVDLRDAGDPVELAAAYDAEGADEVVFLDITATSDDRVTTVDMAARAAGELAIPYTVGGGFRDLAGMRRMVAAGADKVSLNSAGEILLTSMDRDGTKEGFDLALTRAVARAVPIPVIASGGVGTLEHFAQGIIEGEADAVLAASVFHFGTFTIRQVKEYMASQGIPVRLDF